MITGAKKGVAMEEEIARITRKKTLSTYSVAQIDENVPLKKRKYMSKKDLDLISDSSYVFLTKKNSKSQIETSKSDIMGNNVSNISFFNNTTVAINNTPNKVSEIEETDEDKLIQTLKNHFLFKDIPNEVINTILEELIVYQFNKGDILYNEGTDGYYFYILAQGRVEASFEGKVIKTILPWTCFGETSLISRCTREETMKCETEVMVYVLDGENFRKIMESIEIIKNKEIFKILISVSLFSSIDNGYLHKLTQHINLRKYSKGDTVLKNNNPIQSLYIVASGKLKFYYHGKEVYELRQYDFFGQSSLFFTEEEFDNINVFNIVSSSENTIIYTLSKYSFQQIIGEHFRKEILYSIFKGFLSNDPYFKNLIFDSFLFSMFDLMEIKYYQYQEKVNDINKKIIIVLEGNLVHTGKKRKILSKGEIIGTEQLGGFDLTSSVNFSPALTGLNMEIEANPYLLCMEFNNQKVSELLSKKISKPKHSLQENKSNTLEVYNYDYTDNFSNTKTSNEKSTRSTNGNPNKTIKTISLYHRIMKLKQIYLFKNLSDETLEKIAINLHKKQYCNGQIIIEENTPGDSFYLISKGKVCITQNNKKVRELEEGSCFGEIALISDYETRTASVIAISQVTCYLLSKSMFESFIDDAKIRDYLRYKIALQDTSIHLQDLFIIKFLGSGKYGNVHLVHNQHNIYAIKSVFRKPADQHPTLAGYYCRERRVMMKLDHPFIVQMVKTLKNKYYCFFLLEYIDGMSLDSLLETSKLTFNINGCTFYIASMLLILDYLHKKQIIHRDIKPSNILVSANGYIKLIDFGSAAICSDYSHSVIGTPYYISPEVLSGKEYSVSCDYWSLGVCFYEMVYGRYPFGHEANNILDIYKEIKSKKVSFPVNDKKYNDVNRMIGNLLEKNPLIRPCNFSILKDYSLFRGYHWNKLIDFRLNPPFKPKAHNYKKDMNLLNPYELIINRSVDKENLLVGEDHDKDRIWAEEF